MGPKRWPAALMVLVVLAVGCGEPEPVPSGANPFAGSPGTPGSVRPPQAIASGSSARGTPPAVRASGTGRPPTGGAAVSSNGSGAATANGDAGQADGPPQFPEEDRAIAEATRLIEENPFTTHVAYNNRAVAYVTKGELELALDDLNQALQIKPDYAEAWYNRGVVYERLGQQRKADADFAEAKRLRQ